MTKSIFIAGTSTDIGKTFITALIVKKLRDNKINAGYYKPVLSGAETDDGKLVPGDAKYVCDISGIKENPQNFISYIYKMPVSPHLAAQIENIPVTTNKILDDFEKLKKCYDYITVEGCGGLFCQLRADKENQIFLTDIIKLLKLDVILITSSLLGTINSTILTVEYAKKSNINIKAIIMNFYDENNFIHTDNKKQIELITDIPVIATAAQKNKKLEIDINELKNIYGEI